MNNNRLEKLQEMEKGAPLDSFLKYAIAIEYLSQNEIEKATLNFEWLLQNTPHYLATYYQWGKLCEVTGHFLKAKIIYEDGLRLATAMGENKTAQELQEAINNIEPDVF